MDKYSNIAGPWSREVSSSKVTFLEKAANFFGCVVDHLDERVQRCKSTKDQPLLIRHWMLLTLGVEFTEYGAH